MTLSSTAALTSLSRAGPHGRGDHATPRRSRETAVDRCILPPTADRIGGPTVTEATSMQRWTPPKWLIVVQGVAAIVLGILLLLAPGASSVILLQFLALYWLVSGIAELVSLIWDRTQWGWKLVGGIVGILAGVAVIQHPMWATVLVGTTLVLFIGIMGIVFGISELIRAFSGGGWGAGALGVANIAIGILLITDPFSAAIGLPLLLGILAIIGGAVAIMTAIRMD
jgi:uncharacterized membrane protein HdeD (DUF308 family)